MFALVILILVMFFISLYLIDIFKRLWKYTTAKQSNFVRGLWGHHSSWQINWSNQFLRTINSPIKVNPWHIKVIKVENFQNLCLRVDIKQIDAYVIFFNLKSSSSTLSYKACCLLFQNLRIYQNFFYNLLYQSI